MFETMNRFLRRKKALFLRRMFHKKEQIPNDRCSALPATSASPWMLTGATVTGNSHRAAGEVCQDAHLFEVWDNCWGVAALSDGAGTASDSHFASALMVKKAVEYAQRLVVKMGWAERNELPSREEWALEAITFMQSMQNKIFHFSHQFNIPASKLHATLIVVIFSPNGLLLVHIGDGRAGCRDMEGNYYSLMTPWEGEQVGQTVFVTTQTKQFRNIIGIALFDRPADAFFLLSDGCENVAWETLFMNPETGISEKKNIPFKPFWDQTIRTISNMHKKASPEHTGQSLHNYLHNGHKAFESEPDDKTMIVGISARDHQTPSHEH